jgi:multidrug efflux system membrane fusion protein
VHRIHLAALFLGPFLVGVAGCRRGAEPSGAQELPVVPVARPVQANVTDFVDYTGRTQAKNNVVIQARVTGYLKKLNFKEGADVKKDEVLFEIDPLPYQAQLKAAEAQLKASEAQLKAAEASVAQNVAKLKYATATNLRYKELKQKNPGAVSERELDQYQAQEDEAIANLDLAKANLNSANANLDLVNANLESARLNLSYTVVQSPINGQISRYNLTYGNLVNQDSTQLTTIVSLNPMYVYFDVDEPTLMRLTRAISEGKISPPTDSTGARPEWAANAVGLLASPLGQGTVLGAAGLFQEHLAPSMKVLMGLPGEDTYRYEGVINFLDNQVNSGTGSISMRGVFRNPRPMGGPYLFRPGMFVRIRLPISEPEPALLIIDKAIISDQGKKKVYVVGAGNKVEERDELTLGPLQENGQRVVLQGLKKDDWVLVGALQQVRKGMTIQPERLTEMPTTNTPASVQPGQGRGKAGKGKR